MPELWLTSNRMQLCEWYRQLRDDPRLEGAIPKLPERWNDASALHLRLEWEEVMIRGGWHQAVDFLHSQYVGCIKEMATRRLLEILLDWIDRHPGFTDAQRKLFKDGIFGDIRDGRVREGLTARQCQMLLAVLRIVRGGGEDADDGRALKRQYRFRIPFSRQAYLLYLFLTSQPLLETEEERQQREQQEARRQPGPGGPRGSARDVQNRHGRHPHGPITQRRRQHARFDAVIWRAMLSAARHASEFLDEAREEPSMILVPEAAHPRSATTWRAQPAFAAPHSRRQRKRGDESGAAEAVGETQALRASAHSDEGIAPVPVDPVELPGRARVTLKAALEFLNRRRDEETRDERESRQADRIAASMTAPPSPIAHRLLGRDEQWRADVRPLHLHAQRVRRRQPLRSVPEMARGAHVAEHDAGEGRACRLAERRSPPYRRRQTLREHAHHEYAAGRQSARRGVHVQRGASTLGRGPLPGEAFDARPRLQCILPLYHPRQREAGPCSPHDGQRVVCRDWPGRAGGGHRPPAAHPDAGPQAVGGAGLGHRLAGDRRVPDLATLLEVPPLYGGHGDAAAEGRERERGG
eukprot:ctg_466.g248